MEQLRQEQDDHEIALTTAVEHGDAIESQLEMVLQTITEHADQIDLQWLGRYIESESAARQDPLTGLANRRMLDESRTRQWARPRRSKQWLAMLLCDVDHFKAYNDRHGHQAGDECLKQIAEVIKTETHREGDLVARFGGEEFVLLLPNTDPAGAIQVARRIQDDLAKANLPHVESPEDSITLSIGVSAVVHDQDDESALFAEVDRLLYMAKQQGRNRIVSSTTDTKTETMHDRILRPDQGNPSPTVYLDP